MASHTSEAKRSSPGGTTRVGPTSPNLSVNPKLLCSPAWGVGTKEPKHPTMRNWSSLEFGVLKLVGSQGCPRHRHSEVLVCVWFP